MYKGLSIALIVAFDHDTRLIGEGNQLLWHLYKDLKYFKKTTLNHAVILGRKTFESIGRPLPNRKNIILTRNFELVSDKETFEYCHSLDTALKAAAIYTKERNSKQTTKPLERIFVIGGGEVYRHFLIHADELYVTEVKFENLTGDTDFPVLMRELWDEEELTGWKWGEDKNSGKKIEYRFLKYTRKSDDDYEPNKKILPLKKNENYNKNDNQIPLPLEIFGDGLVQVKKH